MTNMIVNTVRFGEVSVDENRVIHFIEPILGFESTRRYVILDHSEDSPFKWLQSVDDPELAFVVTNPKFFGIDYEFTLADDTVSQLQIEAIEDTVVLTIVNIPQDDPSKMTTNLLGPIVISQKVRKAMQVVLHDTQYNTKTRLIPDELLQQQPAGSPSAQKGD
jgi:flagellar assembly factor FliW